jgi:hypothetical protein
MLVTKTFVTEARARGLGKLLCHIPPLPSSKMAKKPGIIRGQDDKSRDISNYFKSLHNPKRLRGLAVRHALSSGSIFYCSTKNVPGYKTRDNCNDTPILDSEPCPTNRLVKRVTKKLSRNVLNRLVKGKKLKVAVFG